MTITAQDGVSIGAAEAEYLLGALDLIPKLLAQRRDERGNPSPSQPTPRLTTLTADLRRALRDTGNGSPTEATTSAAVTTDDLGPQDSAREVTPDAAARILGCTPRNARDLAARGRIHARRSGSRWLLDATSVEAFAAQRARRRAE